MVTEMLFGTVKTVYLGAPLYNDISSDADFVNTDLTDTINSVLEPINRLIEGVSFIAEIDEYAGEPGSIEQRYSTEVYLTNGTEKHLIGTVRFVNPPENGDWHPEITEPTLRIQSRCFFYTLEGNPLYPLEEYFGMGMLTVYNLFEKEII